MIRQITVRNLERPFEKSLSNDINWVCESFGFYEKIDKNKTSAAIFKILLEKTRNNQGVTTRELAKELKISRISALNHMKKFITAGLASQEGLEYWLRSPRLQRTIRELRKDLNRIFEDIEEITGEIDSEIGLSVSRTYSRSILEAKHVL